MKYLITYRLDQEEHMTTNDTLVEASSVSAMAMILSTIEKTHTVMNIENVTVMGGRRFNDEPDMIVHDIPELEQALLAAATQTSH